MMNGGSEKLGIFLMKRQHQAAFFSFHFAAFYFNFAARSHNPLAISLSHFFCTSDAQTSRSADERWKHSRRLTLLLGQNVVTCKDARWDEPKGARAGAHTCVWHPPADKGELILNIESLSLISESAAPVDAQMKPVALLCQGRNRGRPPQRSTISIT